jgi:hypothetical protein
MNILHGGYVVLAIASCAAGCATPAPESAAVRIATTSDEVTGCNLLGKVIVADGPNAEKEARAQVVSVGGNVLLRKTEQVWNGNAYHCPPPAH